MKYSTIALVILLSTVATWVNASPNVPNVFSPEDIVRPSCVGCCDENGNPVQVLPNCACNDPVDPCGVCNGDGSSCNSQCKYISGRLNDAGEDHSRLHPDMYKVTGDRATMPCIDAFIANIQNSSRNWTGGLRNWNDDQAAVTLAELIFPDRVHGRHKVGTHSNGAVCNSLYRSNLPDGWRACGSGSFLLDSTTCQVVQNPTGTECGSFELNYYRGCPVSLIWEKGAEIISERNIVKFSLGYNSDQWTVWKGSKKTPLLVYDPNHTGKIESATQLFGEWTFGGKKFAAMSSTNMQSDIPASGAQPWKNGYEALATLDHDQNGKIDGEELKVLALWFDENMDAVSQAGEIKPLEELGLTAIYYSPDREEANGDIFVNKGFERTVDGEKIVGQSVDWYSEVSDSPLDLINLYSMDTKIESSSTSDNQADEIIAPVAALNGEPSKFSGIWKWSVDPADKKSEVFGGYLIFTRLSENGDIFGYSLNERGLATSPSKNIKSGGSIFAMDGKEGKDNKGNLKLAFSSNYKGGEVKSEAILSADGQTLTGTSVAKGTMNNEIVNLTYRWTATKQQKK